MNMKKWWGVGGNPEMDLTIFCPNRFFLTLANVFIQRKLKHGIQGEKKVSVYCEAKRVDPFKWVFLSQITYFVI